MMPIKTLKCKALSHFRRFELSQHIRCGYKGRNTIPAIESSCVRQDFYPMKSYKNGNGVFNKTEDN